MRVLLVNPPAETLYKVPPLGLGYLGASLIRNGHEVKILDGALKKINDEVLKVNIKNFKPDIVGFTAFTIQYGQVRKLVKKVKKFNKNIITIFGGQHATALYELVMKENPNLDFIIRGEGEESFPVFLKSFKNKRNYKKVPGLVYRKGKEIIANEIFPIQNLDSLAYPWEIINPLDYQTKEVHGYVFKNLPIAPIISSRGCPYRCTFCGGRVVLGNIIRRRTTKNFIDEIEFLVKNFGIKEIQIVDDNFTFYKDHAEAICKEILKRKLKISWSLPNGVRADRVDIKLLKLMKKAGCFYLAFGFEFGSERILRLVKKGIDENKAKKTVFLANKLGFISHGFFLMGYPEETREDIRETIKLMCSLPFDRVSIGFVLPLPGSELFSIYQEKKYFDKEIPWEKFTDGYKPKTPYIKYKDLVSLRREAYFKFYTNPKRVINHLLKLKNLNQLIAIIKGGGRLFLQTRS